MNGMRTIGWLAFAVAMALACHLLLDMQGGGAAIVRRTSLGAAADGAVSLSVSRRGEPPVELELSDGAWRMTKPFGAAADAGSVMRLADALAFAPILDSMDDAELAKLGRRRRDFGLENPRVTVEARGPSGSVAVSFGAFTPSGDGVYAAVDGLSTVFVAGTNVFAAADMPADGFRSRALFADSLDEVSAFDIKSRAGPFMRIVRDGSSWRMAEPQSVPVSSQRVKAFLEALAGSRAGGFAWPAGAGGGEGSASVALLAGYGLDPENATTVTLKNADGTDHHVSFGKAAGKGCVYALVHNGGAVATVDSSLADMVAASPGRFADTRIFPCEEAAVVSVSVSDGEAQCLVAKGADGMWMLDAPVSAPADQAAVGALVARLMALRSADLDPSGVTVAVNTNMQPACVSRESVFAGGGVEDLRSREIAKIDPARVRRVVSTPQGGRPTAVVYDADRRSWSVETSPDDASPPVDTDAVLALVSALDPLVAERVAKLRVVAADLGKYGLEIPWFTVAIDRSDEGSVRRNVRIGDRAGDGRYATLGTTDAVFVLSADTVRALTAPLVRR